MSLKVNRRTFLASAAGAGLASGILPGAAGAQSKSKSSINVRVDRDLTNFDPSFRIGPWDGNVSRVVFQRLMKQKANSAELELEAAEEVKVISPTTIEFRLKPGQMFTDGYGEMTADDVKFSFERIGLPPKDGSRESTYKGDWSSLVQVEVTGTHSGRIILSKPTANVFDIGIGDVSGCIVSKRAVQERGADHATKPVGSGPYQLTAFAPQRGVTLRLNPAYSGPKPQFEEINIRTISDPRTTDLAIRSGEIDFAALSPSVADPLRSVADLKVADEPSIAYLWLGLNTEKGPLSDIRVRKAIRLGLDVDQMLLAGYNGKAPRLNTLLPPQILGHWKDAPVYKRNVAEAKSLLQAAGVQNLKLRLMIQSQPAYQNMALVARALLAEIGVTVDVDAKEGSTFWNSGQGDAQKDLDLFILRFNGKHDPNFIMQWFVSSQIGRWNWERWASPEFDKLYEAAAGELDRAKRADLVVSAQKLMDESAAFVWLTNEVNSVVSRSWLRGAGVPGWIDWQYEHFKSAQA